MMLNVLILTPIAGGIVAALVSAASGRQRLAGALSVAFALAALVEAAYMALSYGSGMQWLTDIEWIPGLGVHYKVGVDGLNLFLLLLTTAIWAASALASALRSWRRPGLYYLMLMLAETAVIGAFAAQDLILFVAFFDLMLVPFYFLIGLWGGESRVRATTKFVIYTLVGSLLMLVAAVATGVMSETQNGGLTFVISELQKAPLAEGTQRWVFLFFAAAFLIKMPAFPLHGWMPDAYREAPIPVLAVLSAILSKVAAYGFLRIVLPLYPDASSQFQELLLVIAVVSIIYGSLIAFTQTSARLVVGYSSVAQLGFITAGIFALRPEGAEGALMQMVNHGLVVAPLFFIIAILAGRCGSDDLREMGGMAFRAPLLAALFLIVALATLAMPGSANFVAEFMILLALFKAKIALAIVASLGVALAAVYMIRIFQRSMHNPIAAGANSREITLGDGFVLVPLVAAIVALAIYPQMILSKSDTTTKQVITSAKAKKAGLPELPPGFEVPQRNEVGR